MPNDAQFWNKLAESYSRKPVSDPAAFERKIAIMQALIQPHMVIADVGCGTGSLALRLASSAREVHGVDLSEAMIRIARGKANAEAAGNVTFHVSAADENLPFEPHSLDGICACSLLHLVDDRSQVLGLVFDLLKPGGFFVTSTPCLAESRLPYAPLLKLLHFLGRAPRVQVFSKQTLAAEILQAGFVDLEQPDVGAKQAVAFTTARKPR